jgi:hypothetical protein
VWQARDVQDSPDANRLLAAIADTLENRVLDHVDPSAQHEVRVAANLCRILQREATLGDEADRDARARMAGLLGHDGPSKELWAELAARLEPVSDGVRVDEVAAHAVLLAVVRGKLAVARPGYDDYDFAAERP